MNTNELKERIQAHFDEGLELSTQDMVAIASDLEAQAYYEKLVRLERALWELPLEEPAPDLSLRVQAHVAERGRGNGLSLPAGYGAVSVLALAAALIGWLFPSWADPYTWWDRISPWLPTAPLPDTGESFGGQWDAFREFVTEAMTVHFDVSILTMGLCLAGAIVFLIAFNGFEARSLRVVSGRLPHGQRAGRAKTGRTGDKQ